jgi:hypothetical protein
MAATKKEEEAYIFAMHLSVYLANIGRGMDWGVCSSNVTRCKAATRSCIYGQLVVDLPLPPNTCTVT